MPTILGPQLNSDPRFNASTGWNNVGEGYEWAIEGDGAAVQRGTEMGGIAVRVFSETQQGERQFLTIFHVDERTVGNVKVVLGSYGGTVRTAPGTYVEVVAATNAGTCGLWTNFAGDARVTLLEVYEIIEV
jgi:hypothetical protein